MSVPYIGFSNETLDSLPPLAVGDRIACPNCGGEHQVKASDPPMLLFYECGGSMWLAAVNGRSTIGVRADVSGKV